MERIFLLYLLSCITFSLKAQDYKVKKGELQIEGTPVAKLEKKEGKYEFSDLSGNFMYKAVLTEKTAQNNRAPHRWVELTGNNGKVREIPLPDKLKFTFSGEKAIVDNMLKSNTGLLTVKGIDPEVVKTFFSTEDRQFSNKWDPIFERVKSEIKAEDKLEESDKITIKEGGIFKKEKRIGSYTKKTNPSFLSFEAKPRFRALNSRREKLNSAIVFCFLVPFFTFSPSEFCSTKTSIKLSFFPETSFILLLSIVLPPAESGGLLSHLPHPNRRKSALPSCTLGMP